MEKRCMGCGAVLQISDVNKRGYICAEKYNDANYCERCFKITHYNKSIIVPLKNINNQVINEVNKKGKYVFFVVDFLNINNETINCFRKVKIPKTLVISKMDVVPKSIKKEVIIKWLKEVYKLEENIIFLSSLKNFNILKIPNIMKELALKEAYILGYTNAGKSTLINSLSIKYNMVNNKITTSLIPNTTLDFIYIKLANDLTVIDSPGFNMAKTFYNDSEIDLIKRLNPKKCIKPITYQVKDITSIIVENRLRMQCNINNSFTFYVSNDLNIEKVYSKNERLLDIEETVLSLEDDVDLVIKGVGFVNVKKACKLKIYFKDIDLLEIRKSMF